MDKVEKLLKTLGEKTSSEQRAAFTAKLETEGKIEDFGENILLLPSRSDDMKKPGDAPRGQRPGEAFDRRSRR